MSQTVHSALYLFDSGAISESGKSNYGAYAQGQVLNALAEACHRDWSRLRPMLGADGDLFARSQLREKPGQKVLHDMLFGYNGLGRDACDFESKFAAEFEYDVVTYCIPCVVAIGPIERIYADMAHRHLKSEKALGYLGICRLPYDLPHLARSMNLVTEMKIEQGRITGALANQADCRRAGLK